jgi:cobalt/nickel transport protein
MMTSMTRCFVLLLLVVSAAPARAHYGILLPESWSVERGKEVVVTFRWGHPFEHELFDAAKPDAAEIIAPDGKRSDVTKSLEKIEVPAAEGKKATAYRLKFTPEQRGDHVVTVTAPPMWMDSEREFWQDTVRVVVHVATQQGWDNTSGKGFELTPLTRPYGLRPGHVFQAQAMFDGKPAAGVMVEVERYNAEPPKPLPPDEQVTRVVKADPNGVATCTLGAGGWWCVTARRDAGMRERDGKNYPVRQRATFWVFVEPPPRQP